MSYLRKNTTCQFVTCYKQWKYVNKHILFSIFTYKMYYKNKDNKFKRHWKNYKFTALNICWERNNYMCAFYIASQNCPIRHNTMGMWKAKMWKSSFFGYKSVCWELWSPNLINCKTDINALWKNYTSKWSKSEKRKPTNN